MFSNIVLAAELLRHEKSFSGELVYLVPTGKVRFILSVQIFSDCQTKDCSETFKNHTCLTYEVQISQMGI